MITKPLIHTPFRRIARKIAQENETAYWISIEGESEGIFVVGDDTAKLWMDGKLYNGKILSCEREKTLNRYMVSFEELGIAIILVSETYDLASLDKWLEIDEEDLEWGD